MKDEAHSLCMLEDSTEQLLCPDIFNRVVSTYRTCALAQKDKEKTRAMESLVSESKLGWEMKKMHDVCILVSRALGSTLEG